jgi:hypothetical protein
LKPCTEFIAKQKNNRFLANGHAGSAGQDNQETEQWRKSSILAVVLVVFPWLVKYGEVLPGQSQKSNDRTFT